MKMNRSYLQEIELLANISDCDIDYSDIPDSSYINDYVCMNNKQFSQFINSKLSFDEFIKLMNTRSHIITLRLEYGKQVHF